MFGVRGHTGATLPPAAGPVVRFFSSLLSVALWPWSRLFGVIRRRSRWGLAGMLLFTLCAALAGVHCWACYQFRAAGDALREERGEEARRRVRRCLVIWPRSAAAHLFAARVERWNGDYDKAGFHVNECVRLQGGATEATQLETVLLRAA